MYKIDAHSHFFDPYITAGISRILKANGIKERASIAVLSGRPFLSPEDRLKAMDRAGVDASTIEYQIVWQHYDQSRHPAKVRIDIARFINDRLAEVQQKWPERYFMMADIPFVDINAAIKEMQRCKKLGTRGLRLNTSFNDKPLSAPEFESFWVEANKLAMPITFHPNSILTNKRTQGQKAYHAMVGFPFDTTVMAIDFMMADFFNKYPKINFMLSHLGGALPFIRKRLDVTAISHPGSDTMSDLIDKFYYDTAISFKNQFQFTAGEVGLDRICFGTDYPYYTFEENVAAIESYGLSQADKEKVYSRNAMKFFGIR